jgi:hypothetical protein
LYGTNKLADLKTIIQGKIAGFSWVSKRRAGDD